ncbi:MAG: methyl-accepting chemotaxis protein [Arcobacteraceae bacterium]|nr:methyl-accepting chemotaxis protein [Arcobacteraceae bacterium]
MNSFANKLRISTKILLPAIIMIFASNIITTYISTNKMEQLAYTNTKESLSMLTDSIFLTLRNAMNSGDPEVIKKAEFDSREGIKGLQRLYVAKSQETIDFYSPGENFTNDKDVLDVFNTKKELVLEVLDNGHSGLRILRPMIATNECLMCHANQKEGDVIGVMDLTFSLDSAKQLINDTIFSLSSIALVIIILISSMILFITKKATQPIEDFKMGLINFFDYISKKKNSIEPLQVHTMDEIGEMVVVVNENINKTIQGLHQDEIAIKESSEICQQASLGQINVKINAKASNPEINNLINIVNKMLDAMNYNVIRVLKVLEGYSNDNYELRINSKGSTKGEFKELFDKVDMLGSTLVKLSGQNLKNGLALQQDSKILAQNVEQLTLSSKEQANSLKDTTVLIADIAKSIHSATVNASKMASLAQEVTQSSNSGLKLANDTTTSMDDINTKIKSISDAITVIEQIAFQTNILSLNAAVEAATAGEAGKGFAVVAAEVRNLASRSAEAAREINTLVTSATLTANNGKEMANNMISGYHKLNQNITSTIAIIDEVTRDSKEQQTKIEVINNAINDIDTKTQKNAQIAIETNIVAQQTNDIAGLIVEDAKGKKFDGKGDIKVRKEIIDPSYNGVEKRRIEGLIKNGTLDRP